MDKTIFKDEVIAVEDQLYEVKGLPQGAYDAQAVQYDKLISNGLYNRIMWGNSPKDYADFCRQGVADSEGIIADIGCGTLGFTHKVYAESNISKLFLCDLSLAMLKIGKNRLDHTPQDTSTITFLRADALKMPFKEGVIQTVLSFGIFHIFTNPERLIQEIDRILRPGGKLFLSSLCTDRRLSRKYLNLLHKKGHVARPMSSAEIVAAIENNGIAIREKIVKGGMVYISGRQQIM